MPCEYLMIQPTHPPTPSTLSLESSLGQIKQSVALRFHTDSRAALSCFNTAKKKKKRRKKKKKKHPHRLNQKWKWKSFTNTLSCAYTCLSFRVGFWNCALSRIFCPDYIQAAAGKYIAWIISCICLWITSCSILSLLGLKNKLHGPQYYNT